MQKTLMQAGRRIASALMLTLTLAHAAHAEPVSKETLRRYFEVSNTAALSERAVESISAMQAKEWKEETKPKEKARKKAIYDKADATIRKYINWPALEPMAIESYQKSLEEGDVQDMLAHAQSPVGQIIIHKWSPALLKQLPAVTAHLEQRFGEISKQETAAPTKPALPPPPPASPKEALARTLMLELPGARDEFTAHMASLEERMLESVAMFGGGESNTMADEMKRLAGLLKAEVTFEEISALKARMVLDALSEADIAALIEDDKKPERRTLIAKQKRADSELQARMTAYMQETVLPKLVPELMKIIGKK